MTPSIITSGPSACWCVWVRDIDMSREFVVFPWLMSSAPSIITSGPSACWYVWVRETNMTREFVVFAWLMFWLRLSSPAAALHLDMREFMICMSSWHWHDSWVTFPWLMSWRHLSSQAVRLRVDLCEFAMCMSSRHWHETVSRYSHDSCHDVVYLHKQPFCVMTCVSSWYVWVRDTDMTRELVFPWLMSWRRLSSQAALLRDDVCEFVTCMGSWHLHRKLQSKPRTPAFIHELVTYQYSTVWICMSSWRLHRQLQSKPSTPPFIPGCVRSNSRTVWICMSLWCVWVRDIYTGNCRANRAPLHSHMSLWHFHTQLCGYVLVCDVYKFVTYE